jgi:hypothetical protein
LIKKNEGEIVFKEHSELVSPVSDFPDVAVMTATQRLNDEYRIQHEISEQSH